MSVTMRPFDRATDFVAISNFLNRHYQPGNADRNWLQPVWEYAYTHPYFDDDAVDRIGIWTEGGQIVAVVMYEMKLGEAFFQFAPGYHHLHPEMLAHAERRLAAKEKDGSTVLRAFVNDCDTDFERAVRQRGYEPDPNCLRSMSTFAITDPFPEIRLPEGFRLASLAEPHDMMQTVRVLHRGFNHEGEPPADSREGRKRMQSGPNFRPDTTIVTVAPDGRFASFAGLWFNETGEYGYVEPVATDPDFRRKGLGRAAVLEGIRRCGERGATLAYVWTDKPFYLSFGFEKQNETRCWRKKVTG